MTLWPFRLTDHSLAVVLAILTTGLVCLLADCLGDARWLP